MDEIRKAGREVETETKKQVRDLDGHDLGDDLHRDAHEVGNEIDRKWNETEEKIR